MAPPPYALVGLIYLLALFHNHQALDNSLDNDTYSREESNEAFKVTVLENDPSEVRMTILLRADSLHDKVSVSKFTLTSLVVNAQLSPYGEEYLHLYADSSELQASFGPHVNQVQCLQQLKELEARKRLQEGKRYPSSRDINLELLLDTWGRRPSGAHLGNYYWPGMHNECKRRKIQSSNGTLEMTRYCFASVGFSDWPVGDSQDDGHSIKVGVCLPAACNSLAYEDKYKLIESIIQLDQNLHLNVTNLYCLPDEQSDLRVWWKSPKTVISIILLTLWLLLIMYSTLTSRYKSLSIQNNFNSLFGAKPAKQQQVVDLSVINGLKVLCACWVIHGHVVIFGQSMMSNMREMVAVNLSNVTFVMGNQIPAVVVNAFFTITGILLAYTSFRSNHIPMASRPVSWIELVWNRYVRMLPCYALMVAYIKYLSKYTGSGPFWDYATAATSPRRSCEQEPWLWTLSFGANWKSVMDHCMPNGWYLANDFQFVLITPILFEVLYRAPKLGQALLLTLCGSSYLMSSHNIATHGDHDLRPITGYLPQAYKTTMTFMIKNYTYPQFRIHAYLAGLLIGYNMYEYQKVKDGGKDGGKPRAWGQFWRRQAQWMSLFLIWWNTAAPYHAYYNGFGLDRAHARKLAICFIPFAYLFFGTACGIIVMLSSTGHAYRWITIFLSAPFWAPLAKLGYCVFLVNIEVITYLLQTRQHLLYSDFSNLTSFFLLSVFMSYIAALALYLLFEAPVGSLLSKLLIKRRRQNSE